MQNVPSRCPRATNDVTTPTPGRVRRHGRPDAVDARPGPTGARPPPFPTAPDAARRRAPPSSRASSPCRRPPRTAAPRPGVPRPKEPDHVHRHPLDPRPTRTRRTSGARDRSRTPHDGAGAGLPAARRGPPERAGLDARRRRGRPGRRARADGGGPRLAGGRARVGARRPRARRRRGRRTRPRRPRRVHRHRGRRRAALPAAPAPPDRQTADHEGPGDRGGRRHLRRGRSPDRAPPPGTRADAGARGGDHRRRGADDLRAERPTVRRGPCTRRGAAGGDRAGE